MAKGGENNRYNHNSKHAHNVDFRISNFKRRKIRCPSCYDTFGDHLPKLFNRIQAGPQHIGKMPGARSNVYVIKKQIEDIRKRMKSAVDEEQFEEAAKLRDEVKELEKHLQFEGGDVT